MDSIRVKMDSIKRKNAVKTLANYLPYLEKGAAKTKSGKINLITLKDYGAVSFNGCNTASYYQYKANPVEVTLNELMQEEIEETCVLGATFYGMFLGGKTLVRNPYTELEKFSNAFSLLEHNTESKNALWKYNDRHGRTETIERIKHHIKENQSLLDYPIEEKK